MASETQHYLSGAYYIEMPVGAYKPSEVTWPQQTCNFNRATTAPGSRSTWWGKSGAPEQLKYIPAQQTKNR